jgi:hypothetical protein
MRCEGGYRGRHMTDDNKRRGQEMRYNGHVKADVEGEGHMAGGEWMMRWGKGGPEKGRQTDVGG